MRRVFLALMFCFLPAQVFLSTPPDNKGIRLEFEIPEPYFIAHLLVTTQERRFSTGHYIEDLQEFFKEVEEKAGEELPELLRGFDPKDYSKVGIDYPLRFSETFEGHEALWEVATHSEAYAKLKQQTESYLESCRLQWERNLDVSQPLIEELTGFDLDKEVTVYVTHPGLLNGRWLGENRVAWGNREPYLNYTTVFLWHEILHTYMPVDHGIYHSLIQLVADNELRVSLNGGSYPPFEGHDELQSVMGTIYPHWLAYLNREHKDILRFGEELVPITPFLSRPGSVASVIK